MVRPTIYVLIALCTFACQSRSDTESTNDTNESFASRHSGSRLSIIQEGNLSPKIALDSLSKYESLYAVGPLSGLKGEVTIYGGEVSLSTVVNNKPKVSASIGDNKAIFLAYANISDWTELNIADQIVSQRQIEAIVREKASAWKISTEAPFVFRLEGMVDSMQYHIIYKSTDAPHNKAEHHKSKVRFNLKDEPIKVVGFWADAAGEGVYTHPGMRIHLHFIDDTNSTSGHIEKITLKPGAKLFLPKL